MEIMLSIRARNANRRFFCHIGDAYGYNAPSGGITTMAIAGAACAGTIYLLSQWAGRE